MEKNLRREHMGKRMENYISVLKNQLDLLNRQAVLDFLEALLEARDNEKNIYIMGNGGSAATASHFVCDFNKGLARDNCRRFRFICLNDNVPSMMAYGNDVGYEDIFVEQLRNFINEGDLVIGISGSGNSMNVVKAIAYARESGCKTAALVGYDGGKLKDLVDYPVHIDLHDMQIVEDIHMVLDHMGMKVMQTLPNE